MKKNKTGIFVIIAIIIVIAAAAFFVFGILNSPMKKILTAAVNTFEEYRILKDIDMSEYASDGDYHADITVGANDYDMDFKYDVSGETTQLIYEDSIDLLYFSNDIRIISQIQGDSMKVQIPTWGDAVYSCDNFDASQIQFAKELGAIEENDPGRELIFERIGQLKFNIADKKECKLGNEDVECKGYSAKVDCTQLAILYEDYLRTSDDDEEELMRNLHGKDIQQEIRELLSDMGNVNITIYLAENVIAEVRIESQKSGDIVILKMDPLSEKETLSVSINNSNFIRMSYDTDRGILNATFDDSGERRLQVGISETEGAKKFVFTGLESIECLVGNVDSLLSNKKQDQYLGHIIAGILEYEEANLSIEISNGSQIEELEGEPYEIDAGESAGIIDVYNEVIKQIIFGTIEKILPW